MPDNLKNNIIDYWIWLADRFFPVHIYPSKLFVILTTLAIYKKKKMEWYLVIYIYIYAFSRRFYPKQLTVHSGYTFFTSM